MKNLAVFIWGSGGNHKLVWCISLSWKRPWRSRDMYAIKVIWRRQKIMGQNTCIHIYSSGITKGKDLSTNDIFYFVILNGWDAICLRKRNSTPVRFIEQALYRWAAGTLNSPVQPSVCFTTKTAEDNSLQHSASKEFLKKNFPFWNST